jgi:hypothetical protein
MERLRERPALHRQLTTGVQLVLLQHRQTPVTGRNSSATAGEDLDQQSDWWWLGGNYRWNDFGNEDDHRSTGSRRPESSWSDSNNGRPAAVTDHYGLLWRQETMFALFLSFFLAHRLVSHWVEATHG